jgi:hypothetical protein
MRALFLHAACPSLGVHVVGVLSLLRPIVDLCAWANFFVVSYRSASPLQVPQVPLAPAPECVILFAGRNYDSV